MSALNRRTVFVEDASSHELAGDSLKAPEPEAVPCENTQQPPLQHNVLTKVRARDPPLDRSTTNRSRFPVKRTLDEGRLVPVLTGTPWNHYESRYRVKYGCSFGIITSRDPSRQHLMIRTISGKHTEEQIQNIRQLFHANIVQNIEIYANSDSSYFLLSEFMPTSLLHLCRSPIYPTEPQLSSILFQVLTGANFLLGCDLVHEELSCANVLVDFAGCVKICDIENCRRSGDVATLANSISRLTMGLMDKERTVTAAAVGLTRPDNWSHEAIDLFTMTIARSGIKQLLGHTFMQKRSQNELVWLIPFVLITANHSRE